MTGFPDHFSGLAEHYSRYRPGYPPELFEHLASLAPSRRNAWDCATGSGQAAVALAGHFEAVIATDASQKQLAAAVPAKRVLYRVAPAEHSGLNDGSVDLVTVAQALHWFDLERFYEEVRRVLRPGGIIAVWSYSLHTIDRAVDAVVRGFYDEVVGPYWPPQRRHVENGYRELAFPFEEVEPSSYSMEAEWDLAHLLGYLGSWSATKRCAEATGRDPLEEVRPALESAWGDPHARYEVRWPLAVKVGRCAV